MLKTIDSTIHKSKGSNPTSPIVGIGHAGANKKKRFSHPKVKAMVVFSNKGRKRKFDSKITLNTDPEEAICFYCQEKDHWRC